MTDPEEGSRRYLGPHGRNSQLTSYLVCIYVLLLHSQISQARLWFHIHRYALSGTLCIFWISIAVHVWTMQSKSIVNSTTACTIRAYVIMDSLDRQSHFLVLYQAAFPRCTLAFKSFHFRFSFQASWSYLPHPFQIILTLLFHRDTSLRRLSLLA